LLLGYPLETSSVSGADVTNRWYIEGITVRV
jgi:hypothetical protein